MDMAKTRLEYKYFLKMREIREYLYVSSSVIYKMVEEKLPRYAGMGNTIYYYKEDIKKFILDRRVNWL